VWSGCGAMVESRPPCRGDEIGKHSGLKALSAQPETAGAEPFKFGETPDRARLAVRPRRRRAKPVFFPADAGGKARKV
ncbi:MAG TPA: hypothetical protein VN289_25390, partial [Paraburkholderia sp.]|nr:hypothetical protein [Paraburkholderia sp.]